MGTAINIRQVITLLMMTAAVIAAETPGWDIGGQLRDAVSEATCGQLKLSLESRGRYEIRDGNSFGKDPDLDTGLIRTRIGATWQPAGWLKLSGMAQDSRAPWYGKGAPNTVRDQADLHESYVELFPNSKTGFGMTAGRMMLNYGEARLIGTPQWGNLARTYDHGRLYYRLPRGKVEFLLVSPVKIRIGEFNHPVLGDRVWGTYNTFAGPVKGMTIDGYFLRHDQNRIGGFAGGTRAAGTDRLGINTFGGRLVGPLAAGLKYSLEGAVQTGKTSTQRQRAGAWFSSVSRRWMLAARTLDVSAEYKYASGSSNPQDVTRSGTFDQLYPANHDKFGHQDLFGWRNLHNARSLATLGVTKALALNAMYNNYWLASGKDSLYNGSGKSIARSALGTAGRHVGQEADLFATWKYRSFTVGLGYARFFKGEFIEKTTPGVGPSYVYFFHSYTF